MLAAALQGVARMAKAADERHWHISVPALIAAAALGAMPLFMARVPWLAFACLTIAAFGIWSPHGPLMSWPAVILSGTNAASGDGQQQCSALTLNIFGAQAHTLDSSHIALSGTVTACKAVYMCLLFICAHHVLLCCLIWQHGVKLVLLCQAAGRL